MIALIVVASVTSAFAPIISKRVSQGQLTIGAGIGGKTYKFSKRCTNAINSDCKFCDLASSTCYICNKECENRYAKNVDSCSCVACTPNCIECKPSGLCKNGKCDSGYFTDEDGTCQACITGNANLLGTSCSCVSNCNSCEKNGNCKTDGCDEGYYYNSGNCDPCPEGKYCPAGSSAVDCPAGKYSIGGASECSNCPAGKYSQSGASICSDCEGGTYSPEGSSTCLNCVQENLSGSGAERCACVSACNDCEDDGRCKQNGCAENNFYTSESCSPCTEGATASAGSTKCSCVEHCSDCYDSGYCKSTGCNSNYVYSDGKCVTCAQATGDSNCTACSGTTCTGCAEEYELSDGSCVESILKTTIGDIEWTTRNAGDDGGPEIPSTVHICTAGSSCSYGGETPTCWKGITANTSGSYACTNTTGYSGCNRTVCNWFAANEICAYNNLGIPTTTMFNSLRATASTTSTYTATAIDLCDAYSSSSSISRCNFVDNCNGAPSNYCYSSSYWSAQGPYVTSAYRYSLSSSKLDGGLYTYGKQSAYSVRCVYDCAHKTGQQGCNACSGSTCTSCELGYYFNGGNCFSCPAGKYSTTEGATSSASCINCPAGKYSAYAGSTSCTNCPDGQTSTAGSSNCVDPCANIGTTTFNGLTTTFSGTIWTTRNGGDSGGPSIPSCVNICNAGATCSHSAKIPLCWTGNTAKTCNNITGYSGCNRTVCNWFAANWICEYNGMSLPSTSQFNALRGGATSDANFTAIATDLIDTGWNQTVLSRGYGANTCTGAGSTNDCYPGRVWSGTTDSSINAYAYSLEDLILHHEQYAARYQAESVRCVSKCPQKTGVEGCSTCSGTTCTGCADGYELENGSCVESVLTTINGTQWTKRNAGDIGGPEIPNTVNIYNAVTSTCTKGSGSSSSTCGSTTPTCWQGESTVGVTTSGYPCTNVTGYSGCNRTVCNWFAANLICKYNSMNLPTTAQLASLGNTNYYLDASLDLCTQGSSITTISYCAMATGSYNACKGSSYYCMVSHVWSNYNGGSNTYRFINNFDGSWDGPVYGTKQFGISVRCVK